MNPWTFSSRWSSFMISGENSFTIRPPCCTGVTCASVRHETTPARSGSSVAA